MYSEQTSYMDEHIPTKNQTFYNLKVIHTKDTFTRLDFGWNDIIRRRGFIENGNVWTRWVYFGTQSVN